MKRRDFLKAALMATPVAQATYMASKYGNPDGSRFELGTPLLITPENVDLFMAAVGVVMAGNYLDELETEMDLREARIYD